MKYQIHYVPDRSPLGWRRGDNFFHCMEYSTTFQIIRELSNHLSDDWKLILTGEQSLPSLEGHDPKKVIVIQISDEHSRIPAFHKDVGFVFKHYLKSNNEAGNVFCLPLGVMTCFVPLPFRSPKDRSIDVFFSGNWHTSRRGILNGLKERLGNKYNLVFLENNAVTMVQPTYSHYLMDSKISLCLDGGISKESYRVGESLCSGCVSLASKDLPNNWIYENSPLVRVDWSNLDKVAEGIEKTLSDQETLWGLAKESFDFYNKTYDPKFIIENHILPHLV